MIFDGGITQTVKNHTVSSLVARGGIQSSLIFCVYVIS